MLLLRLRVCQLGEQYNILARTGHRGCECYTCLPVCYVPSTQGGVEDQGPRPTDEKEIISQSQDLWWSLMRGSEQNLKPHPADHGTIDMGSFTKPYYSRSTHSKNLSSSLARLSERLYFFSFSDFLSESPLNVGSYNGSSREVAREKILFFILKRWSHLNMTSFDFSSFLSEIIFYIEALPNRT